MGMILYVQLYVLNKIDLRSRTIFGDVGLSVGLSVPLICDSTMVCSQWIARVDLVHLPTGGLAQVHGEIH